MILVLREKLTDFLSSICSFATLLVYKVPIEDVKSLSHCFAQLENGESTYRDTTMCTRILSLVNLSIITFCLSLPLSLVGYCVYI